LAPSSSSSSSSSALADAYMASLSSTNFSESTKKYLVSNIRRAQSSGMSFASQASSFSASSSGHGSIVAPAPTSTTALTTTAEQDPEPEPTTLKEQEERYFQQMDQYYESLQLAENLRSEEAAEAEWLRAQREHNLDPLVIGQELLLQQSSSSSSSPSTKKSFSFKDSNNNSSKLSRAPSFSRSVSVNSSSSLSSPSSSSSSFTPTSRNKTKDHNSGQGRVSSLEKIALKRGGEVPADDPFHPTSNLKQWSRVRLSDPDYLKKTKNNSSFDESKSMTRQAAASYRNSVLSSSASLPSLSGSSGSRQSSTKSSSYSPQKKSLNFATRQLPWG
jgi:hypothetical protein